MRLLLCVMLAILAGCSIVESNKIRPAPVKTESIVGMWKAIESDFNDYQGEVQFYDILNFHSNGQVRLGSSLHREETTVNYVQDGQIISFSSSESVALKSLQQSWSFEVWKKADIKQIVVKSSQHTTTYITDQQVLNDRILGQWQPSDNNVTRLRFLGNERFGLYSNGKRKAQGVYRLWDSGKRGLRLSMLLTLEESNSAGMLNYRILLNEESMQVTPLQNGKLVHKAAVLWMRDKSF